MWRKWVISLGGAGFSPVAPGTAGSFVAALLALGLFHVPGVAQPISWNGVLILGILLASVACVTAGPWAIQEYGRKDPGQIVVDEAAGMWLSLIGLPIAGGWRAVVVVAAAFVAFRVFDILKPPPARQLEKVPAGWGVLLDDLMAGVYANIACQILLRWILTN